MNQLARDIQVAQGVPQGDNRGSGKECDQGDNNGIGFNRDEERVDDSFPGGSERADSEKFFPTIGKGQKEPEKKNKSVDH
jgi:hypothetical protein